MMLYRPGCRAIPTGSDRLLAPQPTRKVGISLPGPVWNGKTNNRAKQTVSKILDDACAAFQNDPAILVSGIGSP